MSVYFIREDVPDGLIKIGTTNGSPHARKAALQTGNPRPLVVLAVVPGGEAEEKQLHERFASLRVGGEWFRPAPELLGFIEGVRWVHREHLDSNDDGPDPDDWARSVVGLSWKQYESICESIYVCVLIARMSAAETQLSSSGSEADMACAKRLLIESERAEESKIDESMTDWAAIRAMKVFLGRAIRRVELERA